MPKFKKTIISILLIGCTIDVFSANPQKLALIIAIGNYPKETGWQQINSLNDIAIIKSALFKQGFEPKNITTIIDQQATKNLIVSTMKSLISKANTGDIIVIHYSGHGQQIQDDNNDEVDGYDEALIPFDACKTYKKDFYEGQNHLRDDEFGSLLQQLREKIGSRGDILVILDACHSGTATRGIESCRGTTLKFEEPGYSPKQIIGEKVNYIKNVSTTRSVAQSIAPIVIISGSGKLELNYEYYDKSGNTYGSLSYAISQVLSNMPSEISYRALFDRIKMKMNSIAPRQTPQIEGDIDKLILGGKAVKQTEYFTIEKQLDNYTVVINGGTLAGVAENYRINIFPVTTINPSQSKPIASGIVQGTDILSSKVILTSPLTETQVMNSRVYIESGLSNKMQERANVLRQLQSFEKTLHVDIEIIPITVKHAGNSFIEDSRLPISAKEKSGMLMFYDGDCFKLKLTNKGTKTAYFQIIDIQPDDKIALLIPSVNRTSQEYYIKANQSIEIKEIFSTCKPFGLEVYKLIATEKPLNLEFIRNKGNINRGTIIDPFEILLSDTYSGVRSVPSKIDLKAIHISSLKFNVYQNE